MKKNTFLKVLSFVICVSLLLPSLGVPTGAFSTATGYYNKMLDSFTELDGTFTLSANSRFFIVSDGTPDEAVLAVVKLAAAQFAADGTPSEAPLPVIWGEASLSRAGDLLVVVDPDYAEDEYSLSVQSTVVVTASNNRGVLYGLNTLLKYIRMEGNSTLSCFTLRNAPDTEDRIFMLDCARKYLTKDWICNLIREISWMGYNTLELHFTEDGGMRLDIWDENYFTSANGNDFSWLIGSRPAYWVEIDDPDQGKFLTAAELVEILQTAKLYGIDVIPAFDTPGHSEYMCRTYESYVSQNGNFTFNYGGKTYSSEDAPIIHYYTGNVNRKYSTVNLSNDTARAFVCALIEDYADFFKQYAGSTDFNLGADEVILSSGSTTYAVGWADYAEEHGLGSSAYDTFVDFINQLYALIINKGYTGVRAYNDFFERNDMGATQKLDPNIEIVFWTTNSTTPTAAEFAEAGRTVYTGIETYCYYVLRTEGGNDARDDSYNNFQFNKATAKNIWQKWDPTLVSKLNYNSSWVLDLSTTQVHLDARYVKGAYYMFWGDYAGLNTEAQVWNGVDSSGTWNLIERMWSNINKMWNLDADSALSYTRSQTVRKAIGDFPGLTDCSTATVLPTVEGGMEAEPVEFSEDRSTIVGCATGVEGVYEIPNGVSTIAYGAFENCALLTGIVIPASVSSIDSTAFKGCVALESITVDSENEHFHVVDGVLYSKDMTQIIKISASVTGEFVIPSSLQGLPAGLFEGTKVTSVVLPDHYTSIRNSLFENCTTLESVTIPASVASVSYNCFNGCTALKTVYYGGTEKMWVKIGVSINNEPLLAATKDCIINGDINADRVINSVDVAIMKSHIRSGAELSQTEKMLGDQNNDYLITTMDYIRTKLYILNSSAAENGDGSVDESATDESNGSLDASATEESE